MDAHYCHINVKPYVKVMGVFTLISYRGGKPEARNRTDAHDLHLKVGLLMKSLWEHVWVQAWCAWGEEENAGTFFFKGTNRSTKFNTLKFKIGLQIQLDRGMIHKKHEFGHSCICFYFFEGGAYHLMFEVNHSICQQSTYRALPSKIGMRPVVKTNSMKSMISFKA